MVGMKIHTGYRSPAASPRQPLGGIETGNKLSQRPVVRQSKLYREKESGNAMKGIMGQDNLAWNTQEQEGVFSGQGVYDAATDGVSSVPPVAVTGGGDVQQVEVEYPLPGSIASCDACGSVVNRYYHCANCQEATGLFDLCTECCAALYLKQGGADVSKPEHATHDYATHQMVHVAPPAEQ
jgi:hypothetical protein